MPAAREFAQFGIRVNAIAPGIFLTPMLLGLTPEAQESLAASLPFPKKLGDPSQYRRAGAPHDREPLPQRRSRPSRRGLAHGAAVTADRGSDAQQHPQHPHRMVRLRSRRDHLLSALFRDFRHVDDGTDRARARHEQDRLSQSLRFRRASAGRDPGAFSPADAVRRRSGDRDDAGRMRPIELSRSSTGSPRPARWRSKVSRPAFGWSATPTTPSA